MFTIDEIIDSTGGRLVAGIRKAKIDGVSIDSRTIGQGELFIAIRGRRCDGHRFIEQAKRRGAGAIIFSNARYGVGVQGRKGLGPIPIIKVNNTVWALGALAYRHRSKFEIPVIAITGSNGKTTTKDMTSSILGKRFNVLCNPGTQNNYIGVPLTMLKLRREHNFAVIEIGANHAGEIDRLSWMIKPTIGVITNIEPSHLEFFKSLRGVFAAKLELTRNLTKNGKLVVNKDDSFLTQLNGANPQIITFGFNRASNFYGKIIRQSESQTHFLLNGRQNIILSTLGRHNVYNALASIALARCFGIGFNEIRDALALFQAPPMRMQLLNLNSIKIINDCYNSNPGSLACALDFLREYSSKGKKIVVCGDMLELGKEAEKLHADIGKKIAKGEIDFLITVGRLSRNVATGARSAGMAQDSIRTYDNTAEAARFLRGAIGPDDTVLIKGSRAMQMENVVKCFTNSSIH